MYYNTLRKEALRGPQTSSEMGPYEGVQITYVLGPGGPISLGGPITLLHRYSSHCDILKQCQRSISNELAYHKTYQE